MVEDRGSKGSSDPRFAGIQNDPKFRNFKKKGLKVKLDDRFSKKDLDVRRKAKVDKYGRRITGESKDLKDFDKYFEKEGKEGKEDESSSSSEDEEEETESKVVDRARGELPEAYTSSESEDSESDLSEEESEADVAEAVEEAKPESGDPSKTLAVVNLDWDHVRAADLMITFSSFLPSGGKIEKICIYPSEFGKERMQREEKEGPPREIFNKKKKHHDEDSDSDVDIRDLYEEGDADKEVDNAALRQYQLERLRYYYAIVYCNNVETGESIYSNCDGTEYESTANIFDLRYVPEGMEFDDEPKDECKELPKNYKPLEFSTDALQHSNVKLTWDETPTDRLEVSKRAFSQKELEDMDFQAYLASGTDESDGEENNNEEAKNKLKSLVGQSLAYGKQQEEEPDMEITFTPGLDDSKPQADEDHEETTIEKVKRKEQERRKARKQRLKELKQQAEQEKKEKLRSGKNKKQVEDESDAKSKAELELLMMEDEDDTEKSLNKKAHFNMNEILKSEKEKKKKGKYQDKGKIMEDEFKPDLNDPRFNEVFENQDFAIDPSQPEYKSTKAMKEILEERSKRAHKKRKPLADDGDSKDNKHDISNIVNKLKKKGNNKKAKR
ncbi:hypothetical protein ZYGR_0U00540 [Zygosaccharomyces rouxii]|uniref:ZYRO0F09944p n=2 Tax=Zygosaccharomyces rouxii TaxID=4956 RepID=C5DY35_ZYGRC|nr:uncharacterized protein ZYRO0F09944g [Zygosaccharomyces rouxii]KAH9199454.1 hypothetical protein LQ764DRAFT_235233 [Zygosaccharomyces rouxii]GAV50198.1 hypothetical protein ZYGR_0U00540 [Zygosaccharomyces rouxii]CAR28696.1 ZYRO0F09944p [Zygosaccharomyces rouxii]